MGRSRIAPLLLSLVCLPLACDTSPVGDDVEPVGEAVVIKLIAGETAVVEVGTAWQVSWCQAVDVWPTDLSTVEPAPIQCTDASSSYVSIDGVLCQITPYVDQPTCIVGHEEIVSAPAGFELVITYWE